MAIHGPVRSSVGLETVGLTGLADEHWNLETAGLYEHAIDNREGDLAADGPLVVLTVPHTGRSADDKFIVRDRVTADAVAWGGVNAAMEPAGFRSLKRRMLAY